MTHPSVTETTIWRAASDVAAGDRIAAGFLPDGDAAEVLFTTAYHLSGNREPFVLVVFRADDSDPDDYHFRADARIPLESVADPSGHGYSREADDPTLVSPGRVPAHEGDVESRIADDGTRLGDEPASPVSRELLTSEEPSGPDCGHPACQPGGDLYGITHRRVRSI